MIRQRILQILEAKGISKYKFYKDTGLSNGYLDKEGAVGSDKCEKIISYFPDVSLEWLILGRGSMLRDAEVKGVEEGSALRALDFCEQANALLNEKVVSLEQELEVVKKKILLLQLVARNLLMNNLN